MATGWGVADVGGHVRHAVLNVTLHQLVSMPVSLLSPVVNAGENPAILRLRRVPWGRCRCRGYLHRGPPVDRLPPAGRRRRRQRRATALSRRDFDWPGVSIAASVMARHDGVPWRLGASDYLAGVRAAGAEHVPLAWRCPADPMGPGPAEAMSATGRAGLRGGRGRPADRRPAYSKRADR